MKYIVKIKKAFELLDNEMDEVIRLKQQHWDYDEASQRKWMLDNLCCEDRHILIYLDNVLFAYLNVVNVNVHLDTKKVQMFGIGNVCVRKEMHHQGYGILIMGQANFWIVNQQGYGILLCKNKLADFYRTCGWEIIHCQSIVVGGVSFGGILMAYNLCDCNPNRIIISKNF